MLAAGEPTRNFVTGMVSHPARESDEEGALKMEAEQQAMGLDKPSVQYVDAAYISAQKLVEAQAEGRELIGPAPGPAHNNDGRFTSEAYQVTVEKREAICPAGHQNTQCSRLEEQATGRVSYRFEWDTATCAACALRQACIKASHPHRSLVVGEHHTVLQARRQEQKTPSFKERMRHRNAIEGTQSELVRAHGLRRARYRGLAKVKLQNYFIGAACNLKRWLRRLAWELQNASLKANLSGELSPKRRAWVAWVLPGVLLIAAPAHLATSAEVLPRSAPLIPPGSYQQKVSSGLLCERKTLLKNPRHLTGIRTVAPPLAAGLRIRVHRVSVVSWTMKDLNVSGVAVEGTVGFPFRAAIFPGIAAHVRCGRPLSTVGSPTIMDGELVAGVIGIELEGDTDSMLVIGALCPLGLDPGARKRREQQRGQNSDDRDHHQQLDQRKATWFAWVFFAHGTWHVRFSCSHADCQKIRTHLLRGYGIGQDSSSRCRKPKSSPKRIAAKKVRESPPPRLSFSARLLRIHALSVKKHHNLLIGRHLPNPAFYSAVFQNARAEAP